MTNERLHTSQVRHKHTDAESPVAGRQSPVVRQPQNMTELLLHLQRTAGNQAVNQLLRQYKATGTGRIDRIARQPEPGLENITSAGLASPAPQPVTEEARQRKQIDIGAERRPPPLPPGLQAATTDPNVPLRPTTAGARERRVIPIADGKAPPPLPPGSQAAPDGVNSQAKPTTAGARERRVIPISDDRAMPPSPEDAGVDYEALRIRAGRGLDKASYKEEAEDIFYDHNGIFNQFLFESEMQQENETWNAISQEGGEAPSEADLAGVPEKTQDYLRAAAKGETLSLGTATWKGPFEDEDWLNDKRRHSSGMNVVGLTDEGRARHELVQGRQNLDVQPGQESPASGGATDDIFYWKKTGEALHTKEMQSLNTIGKGGGVAIFVMTSDGKVYVADHRAEYVQGLKEGGTEEGGNKTEKELQWIFHHSSFLGGKPVAAAGELEFNQGRLVSVTDGSGHYQPDGDRTVQILKHFVAQSVDISGVTVGLYNEGVDKSISVPSTVLIEYQGNKEAIWEAWDKGLLPDGRWDLAGLVSPENKRSPAERKRLFLHPEQKEAPTL